MEYFGYKPREGDNSYIDWANVTKTISDEIQGVITGREEKRKELEEQKVNDLKELNKYVQGMNPSLNVFAQKGAQNFRDFYFQAHKQMKAGKMSVDDTRLLKQNIMDGWSVFNQAVTNVNTNIEKLSESRGKGNNAVIDEIAKMMDFGKMTIVPDTVTGEPMLVGLKEDGSLDKSNIRPARALANVVGQKFDFVDVESTTKKIADSAGVWKQTFAGGASVEDAKRNPKYNEWIDNTIKSNLNTDEKIASVLMDYLDYEYTTSGEEGKINLVFDKQQGKLVPQLTDTQRQEAKDAFRTSVESKIGVIKSAAPEQKLTVSERKVADISALIDKVVLNGDFNSLNMIASALGFSSADVVNNEYRLKRSDEQGNTVETVSIPIGPELDATQLGKSIASRLGLVGYDKYTKIGADSERHEATKDLKLYPAVISEMSAGEKQRRVSQSTISNLSRSFKVDQLTMEINPNAILTASQRYAQEKGIPIGQVQLNDAGQLIIGGNNLGDVTSLNEALVIDAINKIESGDDSFVSLTKGFIGK